LKPYRFDTLFITIRNTNRKSKRCRGSKESIYAGCSWLVFSKKDCFTENTFIYSSRRHIVQEYFRRGTVGQSKGSQQDFNSFAFIRIGKREGKPLTERWHSAELSFRGDSDFCNGAGADSVAGAISPPFPNTTGVENNAAAMLPESEPHDTDTA
jgi:hypothetical protein